MGYLYLLTVALMFSFVGTCNRLVFIWCSRQMACIPSGKYWLYSRAFLWEYYYRTGTDCFSHIIQCDPV